MPKCGVKRRERRVMRPNWRAVRVEEACDVPEEAFMTAEASCAMAGEACDASEAP